MTYSDPEKRRAYQRTYYHKKLAPGGEKYEEYRIYQREYYREQLGVGGEKHEQYIEKHRKYNNTYQKHEHYKVGKRWRDNGRYQREKLQSSLHDGTDLGWLKRRRIRNRLKQLETTLLSELDEETLLDLLHIILAHHGTKEFGSPVYPATIV